MSLVLGMLSLRYGLNIQVDMTGRYIISEVKERSPGWRCEFGVKSI